MKMYGRIQDGLVAEIVSTGLDISTMFNPALIWVDLTAQPNALAGWRWDGQQASAPQASASPSTANPATLAQLQVQISTLQARLAAMTSVSVVGASHSA